MNLKPKVFGFDDDNIKSIRKSLKKIRFYIADTVICNTLCSVH